MFDPIQIAHNAKRWVIKVGTSELTEGQERKVTPGRVEWIASQVVSLWKMDKEAILVTSGAIGIGMGVLNLKTRPKELAQLQAAAATGQGKLMQWYTREIEKETGCHAAQVLLTREDLEDPKRKLNVQATLETLLKARIIPIINENDTVSTEEIRYGDNDILSAHVAVLMKAEILLILTDVDKLIGPKGDPLNHVPNVTWELEQAARGTDKSSSVGGMKTKLEAAKLAIASNIPLAVMTSSGSMKLIKGQANAEQHGTWFVHE